MTQPDVQKTMRDAVIKIIRETTSTASINRSIATHEAKIHFIPPQYRVIGGLLQALNIKFGNFIEKLLALVVERDPDVQELSLSGKRVSFSMTSETDALVDRYITSRQLPESPDNCYDLFHELLEEIYRLESQHGSQKQTITKDVDALFRSKDGQTIYLEVKYNDDHDTGKFVDINRKFIKTYAGLINKLDIMEYQELKPILYYFNPVKRWGPIYVPTNNIYRGAQLFDEFFETKFIDVDNYLRAIGDDPEIIEIFDDLYKAVRFGIHPPDLV